MDLGLVRRLREEYEQALDDAERRRAAYHQAIRKLYMSGVPLREIADGLGVSRQRIHQIVGAEPPKRRKLRVPGSAVIAAFVALTSIGVVRATSPPGPLILSLLPEGVSAHRVDGELVFLRRTGLEVEGFLGRAPHLNEFITWCPAEEVFASPTHGELFDAEGRYVAGPAVRDLDRVEVELRGEVVAIHPDRRVLSAGRSRGVISAAAQRGYREWIEGTRSSGFCRGAIG